MSYRTKHLDYGLQRLEEPKNGEGPISGIATAFRYSGASKGTEGFTVHVQNGVQPWSHSGTRLQENHKATPMTIPARTMPLHR